MQYLRETSWEETAINHQATAERLPWWRRNWGGNPQTIQAYEHEVRPFWHSASVFQSATRRTHHHLVPTQYVYGQGTDLLSHWPVQQAHVYQWSRWRVENIAPEKIRKKFKINFTKAVMKNQKRSVTLREIGTVDKIKDQVETRRENMETVAKFQIEQQHTWPNSKIWKPQ